MARKTSSRQTPAKRSTTKAKAAEVSTDAAPQTDTPVDASPKDASTELDETHAAKATTKASEDPEPAKAETAEHTTPDTPVAAVTSTDAEVPEDAAEPPTEPDADAGLDAVDPGSDKAAGAQMDSTPPSPPPPPKEIVVERGGVMPMLFGGLVAGLIGFGAGYYLLSQSAPSTPDLEVLSSDLRAELAEQSAQMDALAEQVASTGATDLSAINASLSDASASIGALADRLTGVEAQLEDLSSRLAVAEAAGPTGASGDADGQLANRIAALQDQVAAQRADIDAMIAESQSREETAMQTAEATLRRAAFTRMQTALDTGGGYEDALSELQELGVSVPDPLVAHAASGVPTLAELSDQFPDAARAALSAARDAAARTGETNGFSAFLRNQLGARSLEPREGDDPDAVLSRAEAALRAGRLGDALAELETLPEVAAAEMADWVALAGQRMTVVDAAQRLGEELN